MSERFLIPCECGKSVVVERRQAGTSVPCECGKSLEVPTIRGFAKLAPAPGQQEPPPPIWGLRQGLVFLGLVIAVPALVFAGYIYLNLPKLTEHYQLLEQEIEKLPPQHTWAIWRLYEEGLPKTPTPSSLAVQLGYGRLTRSMNIALGIGCLGLLIAAAGFLVTSKPPATAGKPRR
jgi:hypothetical protein